jgi:hypothetical protein
MSANADAERGQQHQRDRNGGESAVRHDDAQRKVALGRAEIGCRREQSDPAVRASG